MPYIVLLLLVVVTVSADTLGFLAKESKFISKDDISASSAFGRTIMANARALANNNNNNQNQYNLDFLSAYSIKFQGCSSKYGDYVVDLDTFVASYLSAIANEKGDICDSTEYECKQSCNNGKDEDCMADCFDGFGVSYCINGATDDNNGFDVSGYGACAQFKMNGRRSLAEDYKYYLGPYCADQGGEIHLGLFTDDTCTTFASNGEAAFESATGFSLPYSDTSLVSNRCLACSHINGDGNTEIKDVCTTTYSVSGKCETKMAIEYPNESACTYVEGIKIIRADGVIRTSAVRKSKSAAVCIGLFLTIAVLLAGYVYYLRTSKLHSSVFLSCFEILLQPLAPFLKSSEGQKSIFLPLLPRWCNTLCAHPSTKIQV